MTYSLTFHVLRAQGDPLRGERLNAGLIGFPANGPVWVKMIEDPQRLSALHSDYAHLDVSRWARELPEQLKDLSPAARTALLTLLVKPFSTDGNPGLVEVSPGEEIAELEALFARPVAPPPRSRIRVVGEAKAKTGRLEADIRSWLKGAGLFSKKVEDLKRGRVVGSYPIDPASDLYCDFALMNGALHVVETLDLRGVDRLTPTMHGAAAIKGITLDEAKEHIKGGRRIALVAASDYGMARPALNMVSRYADQVWDMSSARDKSAFYGFVRDALHQNDLPQLALPALDVP